MCAVYLILLGAPLSIPGSVFISRYELREPTFPIPRCSVRHPRPFLTYWVLTVLRSTLQVQ